MKDEKREIEPRLLATVLIEIRTMLSILMTESQLEEYRMEMESLHRENLRRQEDMADVLRYYREIQEERDKSGGSEGAENPGESTGGLT